MPTTEIDSEILSNCSTALQVLNQSPQGKLIALIGRSALQGCVWSDRLNEICVRAAEQTHTTFDEDEVGVLTELYGRITTLWTKTSYIQRTTEEIQDIVRFWWRLQMYRKWWLERHWRYDTAEEILNGIEIQKVKRDWEDGDIWWELTDKQRTDWTAGRLHLPSVYNAALNNKSGWALLANAIIKYRLPQLPNLRPDDGVAKHINIIDTFCNELLDWMKRFASSSVAYWQPPRYKKARATSVLHQIG